MNTAVIKCTVCDGDSILWIKLQGLELRKCGSCSHCFTDAATVKHEAYTADYYLETHRHWFENPNYELFSLIKADLLKRKLNTILDVGCGNGDFLKYMANEKNLRLFGVDLAPVDTSSSGLSGVTFLQGDFLLLDFPVKFDAIVSLAVIEHLQDVRAFQKRMSSVLREKGIAYIMTINSDGLLYRLANIMRKIKYSLIFKRLYDPHHLNHFNKQSLKTLLTQNQDFTVLNVIDHNVPLAAIDIPMRNGIVSGFMRIGVKLVFMLGKVFGKTYLQTLIVEKH